MINGIQIGYIRSFKQIQKLRLVRPDGTPGSGYNLILGKNNAGKSTLLKMLRDLLSRQNSLTVGMEARHDPRRPRLSVEWVGGEATEEISFTATTGGLFVKNGPYAAAERHFRYVPSRRPFAARFGAAVGMAPADYEWSDYLNRRNNLGYVDSNLATSLAPILMDDAKRGPFIRCLQRLDPRISALDVDNVGGSDVIRFRSASGRWHPVVDTGEGIVNSVRIIFSLLTAEARSCIVVDEPELSLHRHAKEFILHSC